MFRFVDHVIIGVSDLDAAARDYEQALGLAVSPGGEHPGAGTRNRLIVLDPEYIELIARVPGADLAPRSPLTPLFARAPGPLGFALASDDLDQDIAAMRERGLTVVGPIQGRLEGPGGAARGWRMASIDADARLATESWRLPFVIQHDSVGQDRRERLARPETPRAHPLGARALAHVTVAVHDLDASARAYALAFGLRAEPYEENDILRARTACLPLAQGAIVLAAPLDDGPIARGLHAQGEGLFSIGLAVDDLQFAVDTLRGRGIGVQVDEPGGVLVGARLHPAGTHGARVELVRRTAPA